MQASPFYPDNIVVAHGMSVNGKVSTFYMEDPPYKDLLPSIETVVAHNLQFDLKYLMRDYREWNEWIKDGKLWCTMVVEYLLSGQTKKFPSLEYCSEKYGDTKKDPLIEEYWQAGTDTTDIPREQLEEYLVGDVENVELVYLAQRKKAEELGMLPLIELHMDALLAIIVMEFNGCQFDVEYSRQESLKLKRELEQSSEVIINYMKEYFDEAVHKDLNPESKDQLSLTLFGGEYSYTIKEQMVDEETGEGILVKSGKNKGLPRLRNKKVCKHMSGFELEPRSKWALVKDGFYSTAEPTIAALLARKGTTRKQKEFLHALKTYRDKAKDLGTYFQGYGKLVWSDGRLHGNLNAVITATGRLSSSNPNLQNLTGGD
jgi:DNA polymerase I-like protein with 3'-5' exonuclease and polymerase domains